MFLSVNNRNLMQLTSSLYIQKLITKVKFAYSKRWIVINFTAFRTKQFYAILHILRKVGLISHFECAQTSFGQRRCVFRIFLYYRDGRPSLKCWHYCKTHRSTNPIPYTTIRQWLIKSPGLQLVFQTSRGLLFAEECITQRQGGFLVLGFSK